MTLVKVSSLGSDYTAAACFPDDGQQCLPKQTGQKTTGGEDRICCLSGMECRKPLAQILSQDPIPHGISLPQSVTHTYLVFGALVSLEGPLGERRSVICPP